MELKLNGVHIKVTYSHTESHWRGKINIYYLDIEGVFGKQISVKFLDNNNREKNRKDLITKGVLSYIVDTYNNKYSVDATLRNWLWGNVKSDWIDSVKVFLKMND